MKEFKYIIQDEQGFMPDRRGFLLKRQENLKVIFKSVRTESRAI